MAVVQPTQDADRNRSLADQADLTTNEMLLSSLDDGLTLLSADGSRGVPILQSIVLDHLLLHDGLAVWVDANGCATTTTQSRIAPSRRLLNRIYIARGFTAYQHYGAVCNLPTAVNQIIRSSTANDSGRPRQPQNQDRSPHTPSLIVAPAVNAQYRANDSLGERYATTLQARTLTMLRAYAEGYDVPVPLTRSERDDFTMPVARAANHHLECDHTRMGPRILGEDFKTLVYPVDDGAYYQTTLAYWRQLLEARAAQVGVEPTTTPSTPTPNGVGKGITVDGESVAVEADPLLDAWTATGTGGR